jgi:hypothetical protein
VISLTCNCGRKLQVHDDFGGQAGTCPACGATLDIPHPEPVQSAPRFSETTELEDPPDEELEDEDESEEEEPIGNHGGDPLPPGLDFFADVPEEIGPLVSAWTTLKEGQRPMSTGTRLCLGIVLGMLGAVLGCVIVVVLSVESEFWRPVWPIGLALLGFGVALACTQFSHTCSYVGREGVARFVCSGSRDNITTREVFRFRDALDLRTSTTLHYRNGSYQHTNYSYTWTDIGGQQRYVISGTHHSEAGTPPSDDPLHYATGSEMAWTMYLLAGASQQIELGSPVLFNLRGGRWIRLQAGVITLNLGGEPQDWQAEEVRLVEVKQGTVRILRHDAAEGWFSRRGVIEFPFDQLPNAQLFFYLMEKVVGVPVK